MTRAAAKASGRREHCTECRVILETTKVLPWIRALITYKRMANFAIVGVAGYIAPRHLKAIADTGNKVVAAYDRFVSVGRLDSSFPDCAFFTEQEQFEEYVDRLKGTENQVDWLTVCTPNHTHAAFCRYGLKNGMDVICEKPATLHPSEIDELVKLEKASVKYFLSINGECLPPNAVQGEKRTYRTLNIDGDEFEFSQGFTELHTRSYEKILCGEGFRIAESRNCIQIVEDIRNAIPVGLTGDFHPLALRPPAVHPFGWMDVKY